MKKYLIFILVISLMLPFLNNSLILTLFISSTIIFIKEFIKIDIKKYLNNQPLKNNQQKNFENIKGNNNKLQQEINYLKELRKELSNCESNEKIKIYKKSKE